MIIDNNMEILIPACELIQPIISHNVLCIWKVITNLDSMWKSIDITLPTKVHIVKAMVFPVVTYSCESWIVKKKKKKGGALKKRCLRALVLEETPESSLDCKEIKPVNLKGDQP